jgi:acetate kinase
MEVAVLIVLALNCGSSSLKFGLYEAAANRAMAIYQGEAEEIGSASAALPNHEAALGYALDELRKRDLPHAEAVGHRFVHGGPKLTAHTLFDADVMKDLQMAVEYAPLHMPSALAVLKAMERETPRLPQVVCLDTAFHRTMPDLSRTYALPEAVRKLGVQRYGFHGLSLESILDQLESVPERLIAAHLGNGASVTAICNGKSIDTTMGLTPTGGVMMGTRCGDLDPGISVFLLRHGYPSAEQLEDLFDHKSGLLGVSGVSSDVRELENQHADFTLRMFCYQVGKAIAAMTAALGGVDLLVFTGGIGEHADSLRREIVDGLKFLKMEVRVIRSEEDVQIAKNTARLLNPQA